MYASAPAFLDRFRFDRIERSFLRYSNQKQVAPGFVIAQSFVNELFTHSLTNCENGAAISIHNNRPGFRGAYPPHIVHVLARHPSNPQIYEQLNGGKY